MKIGILVSQFNVEITDRLLAGAERGLKSFEGTYDVVKVPGAFELPLAAAKLAETNHYDALIALGVVVKGDTDHYDMICRACTDGLLRVMLDHQIPIAFEVLMVAEERLAAERAGEDDDNKGFVAAQVAREMIRLFPRV